MTKWEEAEKRQDEFRHWCEKNNIIMFSAFNTGDDEVCINGFGSEYSIAKMLTLILTNIKTLHRKNHENENSP